VTAEGKLSLKDVLFKTLANEDGDFLRKAVEVIAKMVMDLEVAERIGAEPYERSEERKDVRNGHRERRWDTRAGTIDLHVPKLRSQGYQPSFLDARRRSEKAMLSVIQEAYVKGVSTRKVEALATAMGITNVDKNTVSRACVELDAHVKAWRERPLEGSYPYVWVDAKYLNVRVKEHVKKKALVVAYAVNQDGLRQVIGVDLFDVESKATWRAFFKSLVARGLGGVRLVISDAHEGLKQAIGEVFIGASWQRCRVHFMRNMLGHVGRKDQPALSALLKSIFAQPNKAEAQTRLREVAASLGAKHQKLVALLEEAEHDVLAFMGFPEAHRRQIHSTNVVERLNKEIGRRADVVGIFPNDASVLRLIGMVLAEQDDEWRTCRRYFSEESMAPLLEPPAAPPKLAAKNAKPARKAA
jgi:transposase-like protein